MCLIVFAWQMTRDYPLVVAANRDEFHRRPTRNLHWWPDQPDILAGRDLQAGGTWFAVNRNTRFATVTNYREQSFSKGLYRSRGELVTDFVGGDLDPAHFCRAIDGDEYAGFNLLNAECHNGEHSMAYVSNRGDEPIELDAGIYGLSNASLDTPWSKLTRCKHQLQILLDSDSVNATTLMNILTDREMAIDDVEDLMEGRLTVEQALPITAPFIVTQEYGTRSSTVLLWHRSGKMDCIERNFDQAGQQTGESQFSF